MKMNHPLRAFAASALALGTALAITTAANATTHRLPITPVHAVFAETDTSTNQIVAYTRNADGTFVLSGHYNTGGTGASAVGATADPLASQQGVTLFNNNTELLAVNPGSNNVSVFSVAGASLRLVQIIGSQGLFPDSVAVHGNLVSVLNAGGTGSVAEYHVVGQHLVALAGEVRSLGLSNTYPPDFLHGAGQVGYTPDGTHLVVTTKASSSSYEVFSVSVNGTLGASPTITAANNAVPFAFNFDAAGNLVAVEASNSSLNTYAIASDGSLTSLGSVTDGAKALCWVSSAKGFFYGSNAGSGTLSSFTENASAAPILVNATAASAQAGLTDSAVSPNGQFLFVESGGTGALNSFKINTDGSLTPVESLWDLPIGAEGIAVS